MNEKLDPEWIMALLRELKSACERSFDGWHVEVNATFRPSEGSGIVTFTVGTRPADEDDG